MDEQDQLPPDPINVLDTRSLNENFDLWPVGKHRWTLVAYLDIKDENLRDAIGAWEAASEGGEVPMGISAGPDMIYFVSDPGCINCGARWEPKLHDAECPGKEGGVGWHVHD